MDGGGGRCDTAAPSRAQFSWVYRDSGGVRLALYRNEREGARDEERVDAMTDRASSRLRRASAPPAAPLHRLRPAPRRRRRVHRGAHPPHEDAWDGRSVQEKWRRRPTSRSGQAGRPHQRRGARQAVCQLRARQHVEGVARASRAHARRHEAADAGGEPGGGRVAVGIGVDQKAVKPTTRRCCGCAQRARRAEHARGTPPLKLRGEKDAAKRKAIFDAVKAAAPADAAGRAKGSRTSRSRWCKADVQGGLDHVPGARASNISASCTSAKGAATSSSAGAGARRARGAARASCV